MKYVQKKEARELRKKQGLAINKIASILNVSKSTVSVWVKDIELTPEQHSFLLASNPIYNNQLSGSYSHCEKSRQQRIQYQKQGMLLAKQNSSDFMFVSGCMLYWAEGSKGRNSARLSNTDKYLVKVWKDFLVKFFDVDCDNIKVTISCHVDNGLCIKDIENHWLSWLGLSRKNLRKTQIITKHPMSRGFKKNKHVYGVCKLTVDQTKVVQQIFGSIKYFANIHDDGLWSS